MSTKQSKRARREAERLARQRRRLLRWAGIAVAVVLATVTFVVVAGSDNEAAASAPDFALENLDGDSLQLSDYLGRPVAVTFMHSY
jgi:cytochrome oxidase Cu insertion factor (SCO1/SenC/PrrC family)